MRGKWGRVRLEKQCSLSFACVGFLSPLGRSRSPLLKKSVGMESLIELMVKRENFVVLCNGCSALHLPGCLESSAHG